jgi:methylenetetrahydrofolate dehydrogenase (NADP+)/methenyltetrahydrofolate cyclohydrolase
MKKKACEKAGIVSQGYDFDESVTQDELLQIVHQLNADDNIHGILVQLPLPSHLNTELILRSIDPTKDVDGLHPVNVANLHLMTSSGNQQNDVLQAPFSIPCTPLGCLVLLERSNLFPLTGKQCVVLGRSHLVGWPMARLLLGCDATVTVVHSKSHDIPAIVRNADIVVAAVGRPHFVKADWLKDGAVVIDVGINSIDLDPEINPGNKKSYKLVGDVDYENCAPKCSKITPVPGGVGPMTIAMLLRNTLRSCERMSKES